MAVEDFKVECVADRPESGMWHCGPNPHWVEVTHTPTQTKVRVYGNESTHTLRDRAMFSLEYLLSECSSEKCIFPERVENKDKEK